MYICISSKINDMKRLFAAFVGILSYISALQAKDQLIFTRISKEEGFTSSVNCIYKEKNGEVWIGAMNGLYSFNGNLLKHHTDTLIRGSRVHQIGSDSKGNFWVLTDRHLLMRKDRQEDLARVHTYDMEDRQAFFSMLDDEKGVWFGSDEKLYRYLYEDGSFSLFKNIKEPEGFLFQNICEIDSSTLLCASHSGILLIDKNSGEVSKPMGYMSKAVSAVTVDSKGRIWLATYNKGIEVFDKDGKLIRKYCVENSELSNNVVLCMKERNSEIWAGTDGGGINIINLEKDKVSILRHISGDVSSFPAHSIKNIYIDDYGNVWAGSIRDGVIRISRSGMKTYSDSHIGTTNGLSNPTALCLHQDRKDGSIWIGTDGEGVNRFDPASGKFTHFESTLRTKVVSIAEYSDTELMLSVYSDRIWLFDRRNGRLRPLEIDNEHLAYTLKYSSRSVNLVNETEKDILMFSNFMWRFDCTTGKLEQIGFPEDRKGSVNVFNIGSTAEGTWFHDTYSVYLLPYGSSRMEHKGSTGDVKIKCGHFSGDGLIWLATEEGICRFNPRVGFFDFIRTDLFPGASSIACDKNLQVWIGTDSGLFAYLPEKGSFAMFGESDGAPSIEYLSKPRLTTKEGEVYLGGVDGLLRINAGHDIDTHEEPKLVLDDIIADGNSLDAGTDGIYKVPRRCGNLEIEISAEEKDIFRQKMYRFIFSKEGIVYETSTPSIKLSRMPEPGNHEVTVSCTRRNGEWTDPVHAFTLNIPQPWYRSWWFICLLVLTAAAAGLVTVLVMIRRKEERLRQEAREQNQLIYQEKVRMLINMSHELRTPLTLIMAPLKRLLDGMEEDNGNYVTLNRIYRQSRRMRDLLNMVLDLRKMEVGKADMKIERDNFNVWIREATEDIVNEEHAQGIEIVLDLDPAVQEIDFDRKKCDTVLTNILINAVKHSRKGDRITITTRLTDDGMVRTSISDEGPGLRNIDPSRMFTRFYQSNNEEYGSGIGLSYSKILVELHGGRIAAENNPDKGATFWWEIPVTAQETSAQVPAKAWLNELMGYDPGDNFNAPESEGFSTSGMTLMLVDDSRDLLDFLREALCQDFARIITAESGNKALEALDNSDLPDIIVSDINMPDGNGFSLCKKLKENEKYSHIPVILLTARGEQQSQSDSYRMGADAFMAKPFETDTLLELIRSILKRKAEIRRRYLDADDKAVSGYGSDEENFILRLNEVISAHLNDPGLDQQLLCRELGMSRAALFNRMKAITGAGVKEYITRLRIEKAKSLIENTKLSIAEISEMTGFASQSYFSTAFKNYTGMTPSQYKKSGNL